MGDLRSGHSRDSDHFILQHSLGHLGDQPSQQTLSLVNTFRAELHDHINPRNLQLYYIEVSGVGHVLLEVPDKASEAMLLFLQGLGLVPAVVAGARRRGVSRAVSMSEADIPNISRLSMSE